MTVTAVDKDLDQLTMRMTAEFAATPERVWRLWADARQLERWWGPPTWPATFTSHELTPGSHSAYHMTGPNGDEAHGWWEIVAVEPPQSLAFRDGFANVDGTPNPEMPVTEARVTIVPIGEGKTRMTMSSRFPSREAMQQVLDMGMEAGLRQAMNQIDAILIEVPA
jgi:uncharacterized protein YndB with AHSA1/START domain